MKIRYSPVPRIFCFGAQPAPPCIARGFILGAALFLVPQSCVGPQIPRPSTKADAAVLKPQPILFALASLTNQLPDFDDQREYQNFLPWLFNPYRVSIAQTKTKVALRLTSEKIFIPGPIYSEIPVCHERVIRIQVDYTGGENRGVKFDLKIGDGFIFIETNLAYLKERPLADRLRFLFKTVIEPFEAENPKQHTSYWAMRRTLEEIQKRLDEIK